MIHKNTNKSFIVWRLFCTEPF